MANKRTCLKVFALIILSLMIVIVPNYSQARKSSEEIRRPEINIDKPATGGDAISNPDRFKPGGLTDDDTNVITQKANNFVGIIVTVGTVTSVITMAILGIKYMLGSVEEKADYKKSMLPYLIGAVLLFASSTVVSIIAKLVQGTGLAK